MTQLKIHDELLGRSKETVLTIECLTEELTVRELIRQRVYQEVDDYNRQLDLKGHSELPKLLVTPTAVESLLNRETRKKAEENRQRRQRINWEKQFKLACEGFNSNAFFILVDDRQAEDLDESFQVAVDTEVTFVKLVPLVGG
jgi:hypothetical protein